MKISIVTISFNQAAFIEEAIRSVVGQDYDDMEYIVVDAGSSDGSREIIERYRGSIDTIVLGPDQGPADGLNKGFAAAHGEVFGFLNADDVLEAGALAAVARSFAARSSSDVVSGHSSIIDGNGRAVRRFYSDRFCLSMAAYGASIISQPSTFFRSTAFRAVGGFNIENRSNWDGELFIDMALRGARFVTVPEFWSRYRVHGMSITGSGKLENQHQQFRERMFRKTVGRYPSGRDRVLMVLARYLRKVWNPADTLERLRFGPIFRSTI